MKCQNYSLIFRLIVAFKTYISKIYIVLPVNTLGRNMLYKMHVSEYQTYHGIMTNMQQYQFHMQTVMQLKAFE